MTCFAEPKTELDEVWLCRNLIKQRKSLAL